MRFESRRISFALFIFLMFGIIGISMSLSATVKAEDESIQQLVVGKASNWLKTQQFKNGSWGVKEREFLDTSTIAGVIS